MRVSIFALSFPCMLGQVICHRFPDEEDASETSGAAFVNNKPDWDSLTPENSHKLVHVETRNLAPLSDSPFIGVLDIEVNPASVNASAIRPLATPNVLMATALLEGVSDHATRKSDSSTPCLCVREEEKHFYGDKPIVDTDDQSDFGSFASCAQQCHIDCFAKSEYKLDKGDASRLSIPEVTVAVSASMCKDGQCKCMDVHQTVRTFDEKKRPLEPEIVHVYETPTDCLLKCKCTNSKDSYGRTRDIGLCLNEWDSYEYLAASEKLKGADVARHRKDSSDPNKDNDASARGRLVGAVYLAWLFLINHSGL